MVWSASCPLAGRFLSGGGSVSGSVFGSAAVGQVGRVQLWQLVMEDCACPLSLPLRLCCSYSHLAQHWGGC